MSTWRPPQVFYADFNDTFSWLCVGNIKLLAPSAKGERGIQHTKLQGGKLNHLGEKCQGHVLAPGLLGV